MSVGVAGNRAAPNGYSDARQSPAQPADPLPPVPEPVPAPVPAPAIVPPAQAFAAALLAEQLPVRALSPSEVRLRLSGGGWQAPPSFLRLADRRV
ncbi:MAG TPA: hypothetical protein VHA07_10430 [Devosia sp.]|nr:hypothetical protein [Devosia sp.]